MKNTQDHFHLLILISATYSHIFVFLEMQRKGCYIAQRCTDVFPGNDLFCLWPVQSSQAQIDHTTMYILSVCGCLVLTTGVSAGTTRLSPAHVAPPAKGVLALTALTAAAHSCVYQHNPRGPVSPVVTQQIPRLSIKWEAIELACN